MQKNHPHSPRDDSPRQDAIRVIESTRHAHTLVIAAGIIVVFFLPVIWPVVAVAVVYGLIVNSRLSRKEKSLIHEILDEQDNEAIFSLNLGHVYNNPEAATLKLWFMPCQSSWPLAKIETGISYITLPLEYTQFDLLSEQILPRIAEAIKDERAESMFLEMKNDLLARGITHPIDIQGWNYHPVIRDFIERILSAEPREKTIAA